MSENRVHSLALLLAAFFGLAILAAFMRSSEPLLPRREFDVTVPRQERYVRAVMKNFGIPAPDGATVDELLTLLEEEGEKKNNEPKKAPPERVK